MKTITLHYMLALWKTELCNIISIQHKSTKEEFKNRYPDVDVDIEQEFKKDYPGINLHDVRGLSKNEMEKESDEIYEFLVHVGLLSNPIDIINKMRIAKYPDERTIKNIEQLIRQ